MLSKISLILGTVVHLRWKQVYYQLYYKIRGKLKSPQSFANLKGYSEPITVLSFIPFDFLPPATRISCANEDSVGLTFLNKYQEFRRSEIPWNFDQNGKLWTYNLNYFDFLFAADIEQSTGLELIRQFDQSWDSLKDGLEPYPISLRIINWVKFLSRTATREESINQSLFRQAKILCAHIEHHIQANHILENGFSLLFAAYHFKHEKFYRKALILLREELEEQILLDGAHYERSPMYHQIILFRLLDAINLVANNSWKAQEMLALLKSKAFIMLSWLERMTTPEGEIPMVKDAAPGIAPNTAQIFNYAKSLELSWQESVRLSDSGYRMFTAENLSLLADVGEVSPAYQPAHAHADEFNFLLFDNGKPIIVDTGTSTYDKNERRQLERSTQSHNCVCINGQNSSNIWGGFRVARRAAVELIEETETTLIASHNGYAHLGTIVTRSIQQENDRFILEYKIETKRTVDARLNLHFHPDIVPTVRENEILASGAKLTLFGIDEVEKESYKFAFGFNQVKEAQRISLALNLKAKIIIEHVD